MHGLTLLTPSHTGSADHSQEFLKIMGYMSTEVEQSVGHSKEQVPHVSDVHWLNNEL